MKIKTFNVTEESEINDFLMTHTPITNGISVKDGRVTVLYGDDTLGLTKKDLRNIMSQELAKVQQNRLSAEIDKRFYASQSVLKKGGAQKQDEINAKLVDSEKEIEVCDMQIKQFTELLQEIEKGEFEL